MILLRFNTAFRLLLLVTICIFFNSIAEAQLTAAFTANSTAGCVPKVVNFTDQSTGGPVGWDWDLGNGTTSVQQNPTTTYLTPGLYTVTLKVKNASGTTNTITKAQYITIDDKPTVNFSATPTTGCFPLHVNFTDQSVSSLTPITAWEWGFGDGATSTVQNPSHFYNTLPSTFTVSLKVTNASGCSRILIKPNLVQVSPGVRASFSNSTPVECKPPETIHFTNNSTGPGNLTYQWLFGDGGTATTFNASHAYTGPGPFTVTLIVRSSLGCADTIVKQNLITVKNVNSDFTIPVTVCRGTSFSITNNSAPAAGASFWNFGDGTTSTATNPVKTYNTAGTYSIKLRNNYGTCLDSVTKTITVLGLPVPDFTAPNITNCKAPFTVNFSNLTPNSTSWVWHFGDGGTSTQQNPSHTYTSTGNYTVKLIATGVNGCVDSIIKNQYVRIQPPTVGINNLPDEGCIPFTISPTPNVTSINGVASYFWDFGDGGTSTQQNPSHTYAVQGTYIVKLRITTTDGCTDSLVMADAVKAGNKSIANFTANPLIQCAGQPVQFTNLTSPSDRWFWFFGDGFGTANVQNPSYAYQDTGLFTVRLIAWNSGCADTFTRTNYIRALPPAARFTPVFNCINKRQVSFTDQSTLPQTWLWNFGDGNTSTLQNPVHTYLNYGTYNVSLTVTNASCTNTRIIPVAVFDEIANFTLQDDTLCTSDSAVFVSTGFTQTNIATYNWDFGDGTIINAGATVKHKYTLPGLFSVRLTITDIRGCVSTILKSSTIRVWGPTASFNFNPITGCRPAFVTFNNQSITDGVHPITNWKWDFGDGQIQNYTAPPFTHMYDTSGYFSIRLTVTDSYGCNSSMLNNIPLYVTEPIADFYSNDTLTCWERTINFSNASTGLGLTYNWDFGDGTTSTAVNPTKLYSTNGDFTVRLIVTDVNGCRDTLTKTGYVKMRNVIPRFIMSDSISSCVPFEVNFTNTSDYANYSVWNFGDGTISDVYSPTHYFTAPGTYSVKLWAEGRAGFCKDSVTKTVIVYPSTANLTYSPLSGCSPASVTFNVTTPGPMVSYLWDFNDGTTIKTTAPTLTYNYLLPGRFAPKVIMEDQTGCQIPVQGIDTMNVTKSNANFGVNKRVYCGTGTVAFSDSTISNGNIISYNWLFGDGGSSTLRNPSHTYTRVGTYDVRLIVTTSNGCRDTLEKTDFITILPMPDGDIDGNLTFCVHKELLVNGVLLSLDSTNITWRWDFGNGKTSTFRNPLPVQYSSPGKYQVRLIVTNRIGCSDTANRTITVLPRPLIDAGADKFIPVGTSIDINPTGSAVIDYVWSPATDLSCTNCYNTTASPKNTTAYNIKVTDANGCINTDDITIFVLCEEQRIYIPNAFTPNNDGINDRFYPRGKGLFKIQNMVIFNRWGEMVFQKANVPANDPSSGWNGFYKGKIQKPESYTYRIEVICENGQILILKGNVILVL